MRQLSLPPVFMKHCRMMVLAIAVIVVWPGWGLASDGSLHVRVELQKTEIIIGEQLRGTLILENGGHQNVAVNHPQAKGGMPDIRLRNIQTGTVTMVKEKLSRGETPVTIPIAPGKTIRAEIALPDLPPLDTPGTYALSVVVSFNGGNAASESSPVRVNVRPVSVISMATGIVQGSQANTVFINGAVTPHEIGLARFGLSTGGGFRGAYTVGGYTQGSAPCLSVPDNKAWANGTWIAWMDSREMMCVHFNEVVGSTTVANKKLPFSEAEIIPPLHVSSGRDMSQREPGSLLIWAPGAASGNGIVQRLDLTSTDRRVRAEFSGRWELPDRRPAWMMNQFRSNGEKLLILLFSRDRLLSLQILAWPEKGSGKANPRQLADWEGEYLAAHATVGPEDTICGALLVKNRAAGKSSELTLIGWTLTEAGRFQTPYDQRIPWGGDIADLDVMVRARGDGPPAALLRSQKGSWQVWDGFGQSMRPVAAPWGNTRMPMDMAFDSQGNVALICAESGGGFSVKMTDGSDLPSFDELK